MNTEICAAIRARAVVQFYYDGGLRTVEPHCHGVSKNGNELLRGYQTGGYSQSRSPIGWKLFSVSKISSLQKTGEKFPSNRADYNPNDRGMKSICCRV